MSFFSLITDKEYEYLEEQTSKLKSGETYVEFGSFLLGTVGRLARKFPSIQCNAIDEGIFNWLDIPGNDTTKFLEQKYPGFRFTAEFASETIRKIESEISNLKVHWGASRHIVIKNASLQFIDADHSYEETMADFWHAWAQAKHASKIIGHDYYLTHKAVCDIEQALNQTAERPVDSLWVFTK